MSHFLLAININGFISIPIVLDLGKMIKTDLKKPAKSECLVSNPRGSIGG